MAAGSVYSRAALYRYEKGEVIKLDTITPRELVKISTLYSASESNLQSAINNCFAQHIARLTYPFIHRSEFQGKRFGNEAFSKN